MGIANRKLAALHQNTAFMKIDNYCQGLCRYKREDL